MIIICRYLMNIISIPHAIKLESNKNFNVANFIKNIHYIYINMYI